MISGCLLAPFWPFLGDPQLPAPFIFIFSNFLNFSNFFNFQEISEMVAWDAICPRAMEIPIISNFLIFLIFLIFYFFQKGQKWGPETSHAPGPWLTLILGVILDQKCQETTGFIGVSMLFGSFAGSILDQNIKKRKVL